MKFILNKDTLQIENIEVVKSGSVNYYEADVKYDESWNNLVIEAVMVKKDEDVGTSIAVINNKMYIDQKLRGTYCIGFIGYKIEEEKKIYQVSTNLQKIYFDFGAGEIETENTDVPTPTEWEVYIAEIQKILGNIEQLTSGLNEKVVEVETKLANGEYDGKDGFSPTVIVTENELGAVIKVTDENGSTEAQIKNGNKGEPGADGYTPQRGVDYWNETDIEEIEKHCNEYIDTHITQVIGGAY